MLMLFGSQQSGKVDFAFLDLHSSQLLKKTLLTKSVQSQQRPREAGQTAEAWKQDEEKTCGV